MNEAEKNGCTILLLRNCTSDNTTYKDNKSVLFGNHIAQRRISIVNNSEKFDLMRKTSFRFKKMHEPYPVWIRSIIEISKRFCDQSKVYEALWNARNHPAYRHNVEI